MICFLKKFTVGFYFMFFFIGVSCVWLESGFSEVQRTAQDISRNIASQLGNSLSPEQASGIAIYDEIQNRTVTGNEIQSVLINIANEDTAENKLLCADILSNLCWNQTLRKKLQENNFPLESFDLLEIRKAAINLYENAQTNGQDVRSGLLALRLANSYTGLAVVQDEKEEKTVSRSAAFQHYLSAYENLDSTEEEKIQALRGAVNTLDALQKLDEQDPVTKDDTVFVMLSDQINRMRSVAKNSAGKENPTLDDLKTIAAFANAVWVIGDSKTAKKGNTTLPSVQEAYEESIQYYQYVVDHTALDKVIKIQAETEKLEWLKTGLDARIWVTNISLDVGYARMKIVDKEIVQSYLKDAMTYLNINQTQFNTDKQIDEKVALLHLIECEFKYAIKEYENASELIDLYFSELFFSLDKNTPETFVTRCAALAHHYKFYCLLNQNRITLTSRNSDNSIADMAYQIAKQLISLEDKHLFPNEQENFWKVRHSLYATSLILIGKGRESVAYSAQLYEKYPNDFPEYEDAYDTHKKLVEYGK